VEYVHAQGACAIALDVVVPETLDRFVEIQVPHLSLRERHLLHGLIESGGSFSDSAPAFINPVGFGQYRSHYLR
jgi:hypothetical protein